MINMKSFPSIRALRLPFLTVMLIALPLFISSAQEFFPNSQGASAKVKTFSPLLPLPPQGRTLEIDIKDKEYFPPARTLKIPPGFKENGARLAVRAGDTIKICNKDQLFFKPFSTSKGNKFQVPSLRPDSCMSYVVQNPSGNAISFRLFDEIHTAVGMRLSLVVLPANAPYEGEEDTPPPPKLRQYAINEGGDYILSEQPNSATRPRFSLSGTWKVGNDWVYAITQDGFHFTWSMGALDETGRGYIEGTKVTATWSGKNGSGSATGTVIVDAAGRATKIQWSNGIVFTRN
jgi:hypothetical protein